MTFSWLNLYRDYIGLYFTFICSKPAIPWMLKIVQVANHFFQTSCLFEAWIDGCCEMTRSVFQRVQFLSGLLESKVNHNFEILDLISMKGTDYDDAGSPERTQKCFIFNLWAGKMEPESVKYWFVKSCCCFVLFIVDFDVSRVVYMGVIVLFLRIPAFGYSL